jgi:hypothetical protein
MKKKSMLKKWLIFKILKYYYYDENLSIYYYLYYYYKQGLSKKLTFFVTCLCLNI